MSEVHLKAIVSFSKDYGLDGIFVIFTCHAVACCHCHHCNKLGAWERTPMLCQLAPIEKTQGRHSTILIFIVPEMKLTLGKCSFFCALLFTRNI